MSASPSLAGARRARVAARNADRGAFLAERVRIADTRWARTVGLLGSRDLGNGEGLWIVPSRGVHTLGMRFTIDVVAIDHGGVVVDVVPRMNPWRIRLPRAGTAGVLELPAGVLERTRTEIGDHIAFDVWIPDHDA